MLLIGIAAAALAAPWTHAETDVRIDFPDSWTPVEVDVQTQLVPGQLLQVVHEPTGGGAVVRAQPVVELLAMPPRILERVGDVEAAMAADRYARVVMLSQEDKVLEDATVYLGISDVVGARVGRWAFTTPATESDPERLWWHATWRTSTHFVELIGWVPTDRIAPFAAAMRTVERNLGAASGWAPGSAMLFRDTRAKCEGPAAADRMRAIAASQAYAQGKAAVQADATDASATVLAELTLLGELLTQADRCVRESALDNKACSVYERASDSARSVAVQQGIVGCLDQEG